MSDFSDVDPHSLGMARVGEPVIFLGKNGYDHELKEANALFSPHQILLVRKVMIGGFSSSYLFDGYNGTFNTVMFAQNETGDTKPEKAAR